MKTVLQLLLMLAAMLLVSHSLGAQVPARRDSTHNRQDSMDRQLPPQRRDTTHYQRPAPPDKKDSLYRRAQKISDTAGRRIPPKKEGEK